MASWIARCSATMFVVAGSFSARACRPTLGTLADVEHSRASTSASIALPVADGGRLDPFSRSARWLFFGRPAGRLDLHVSASRSHRVDVRIGCHRRTLHRNAFATNSSVDGPHTRRMVRSIGGRRQNSPMPRLAASKSALFNSSDESRDRARQIVSGFHMAEGIDQRQRVSQRQVAPSAAARSSMTGTDGW